MTYQVKDLLNDVDLELCDPIIWKEVMTKRKNIPTKTGIYIIALPSTIEKAPINIELIENWVKKVPSFKLKENNSYIDSTDPSLKLKVKEYLESFWLSDEVIIYIGMADPNTIRNRLTKYWDHHLGDKHSHSGGHWLKTFYESNQDELLVYWAITNDAEKIEKILLEKFSKKNLITNPNKYIPFANLEHKENGKRIRKQNKLRGTIKKSK